jgi:uncharacterized membrane protein YdjX (TVP38/TMEM64 family)
MKAATLLKRAAPLALGLGVLAWLLSTLELDWAALFRGDIDSGAAALRQAAERQGPMKDFAMALMVGLLPFVAVPVTLAMLAAALMLAPLKAVPAMLFGTLLNTAIAYGIGRHWGKSALDVLGMDKLRLLKALEAGSKEHGLKMAVFSRCFPIPFALTGVAAGAVGIKLWQMLLGTAIIMLPTSLIYVFFTEALRRGDAKFLGPTLLFVALLGLATWYVKRSLKPGDAAPDGPLKPQAPPLGPVLTLYTLAGHDASEDARKELWALRPRLKFEIDEIEIGEDQALNAKYHDLAPVILLGERRLFSFQVDANALEKYLRERL